MYSQLDEERVIVDWFRDKPVGKYLDIGAWDGIEMSNTRRLAELGWAGVPYGPYDFLSVDAEGADMVILRALSAETLASLSMIAAEVPSCETEALAILAPHGFQVHYRTTCNVLFVKKA